MTNKTQRSSLVKKSCLVFSEGGRFADSGKLGRFIKSRFFYRPPIIFSRILLPSSSWISTKTPFLKREPREFMAMEVKRWKFWTLESPARRRNDAWTTGRRHLNRSGSFVRCYQRVLIETLVALIKASKSVGKSGSCGKKVKPFKSTASGQRL